MHYEGVKLSLGFGTERNHPLGVGVLSFSSSAFCMRAMLERSRSSTGSSGTVCPAAICASLRARLAVMDSGMGLSGETRFMGEFYHKAPRSARENRPPFWNRISERKCPTLSTAFACSIYLEFCTYRISRLRDLLRGRNQE